MLIDRERIYAFVGFIFISLCVILPAGQLGPINVKIIALASVILTAALINHAALVRLAMAIMPSTLVLCFLLIISLIFSGTSAYFWGQTKDIFTFFVTIAVGLSLRGGDGKYHVVYKSIMSSLIILGIVKIGIIVYCLFTGAAVSSVMNLMSELFGTELMTYDVGSGALGRMNFASDNIIPAFIFILFSRWIQGGGRKLDVIFILIILVSAFLSMSRFVWGSTLFCLLLALFLNAKKKKSVFLAVSAILIAQFFLSLDVVQESIAQRLDQSTVVQSDSTRLEQLTYLYRKFSQSPFLGHGLGYYLPEFVRSSTVPYAYEVQFVACLMQIGLLGMAMVMTYLVFILFSEIKGLSLLKKFCVFLIFLTWIASSFFNPSLFSSSGAAVFLSLILIKAWSFNFKYSKVRIASLSAQGI